MVQGSGDGREYRAWRLGEDLATNEAVDAFVAANEERWNDGTWKKYRWVLDNFAETFPILPTTLDQLLNYVANHTLKNSRYLWELGTVRSCYKVIRTFYSWARAHYPGAEHLLILPSPSHRRIQNFGRKRYRQH